MKYGQSSRQFTFTRQKEGGEEEELECVTEDEAVNGWLALFEKFHSSVVLGYSVAEQLAALLASTVGEARSKVATTVAAIVDLRWLPHWQGRRLSLNAMLKEEGLDKLVSGQANEVTRSIAAFVLRGGENLKKELLASTIPCSFHFLFLATKRDVEIVRKPSDSSLPVRRKVNKEFSNCVLV